MTDATGYAARDAGIEAKSRGCRGLARRTGWAVMVLGLLAPELALGQIPGLPAAPAKPAATPKADPAANPVPAKENPGAVFSATSEPIKVDEVVDDGGIEETLGDLLRQYPGVRAVTVNARQGFITLDGQASDEDTIEAVTRFAQKVEGVRLILNKMKTDAEVLSGPEMAGNLLLHYRDVVARNWLLAVVALGFLFGFVMLGRLFSRYSETLLAPFVGNTLLRSVVGSIVSSLLILGGVMISLSILDLTQAVMSILGLAGVVGLAVGFAFRDIVENFIASMLLGIRRPFGIGDFITVAGRSGSVLALDTRATTLITPEGSHVRIPNAVIYKETLVNASVTPSTLGSIEVLVPYESSTATAIEAITEALGSSEALRTDPKPRVLVQALEVNGVRLKATYWMPTKGVDNDKVQSDLRLKIKVGLQKAGITPPSNHATVSVSGPIAIAMTRPHPEPAHANGTGLGNGTGTGKRPPVAANPASEAPVAKPVSAISEANLRKDTEAAAKADTESTEQVATPIDHAIRQAEAAAAEEGGNLLVNNGKA